MVCFLFCFGGLGGRFKMLATDTINFSSSCICHGDAPVSFVLLILVSSPVSVEKIRFKTSPATLPARTSALLWELIFGFMSADLSLCLPSYLTCLVCFVILFSYIYQRSMSTHLCTDFFFFLSY